MRFEYPAISDAPPADAWQAVLLGRLCREPATPAWAGDVAAGVAAWCRAHVGAAAVREEDLDAWLAHAASVVAGPAAAAEALPGRRMAGPDALRAPALLPLLRGGALSVRRLDSLGGGWAWRLDLGRLARGAAAGGELPVLCALRAALQALCSAWRGGVPVLDGLGLAGVGPLAARMIGRRGRTSRSRARARGLRDYAAGVLAREGFGRVAVVRLDLA